MKRPTRFKLDTGTSVEAFSLLHPDDNEVEKALVQQLVKLNARASAPAQQQRAGLVEVKEVVASKAKLRGEITGDLSTLHRISAIAGVGDPTADIRFRIPGRSVSHMAFLTAAQVIRNKAAAVKDQLLGFGMPDTLLDRLTANIARYEAAVSVKAQARASHVGATAELNAVADAIMETVRHLDVLFELRFRDDGESLAAWKSARNVPWPVATESTPKPEIESAA
jgi:hypothetical protein